jgi:hypothetical protein
MSALVEKIKAILPDRAQRNAEELQAAKAELVAIEKRRQAILAFDRTLLGEIGKLLQEHRVACSDYEDALREQNVAAVGPALQRWALSSAVIGFLRDESAARTRGQAVDQGRVLKLKTEFPDLRQLLQNLCALRLAEAKSSAGVAFVREKAQLASEGFTDEQINNSPRCKRANTLVSRFEAVQKQIETQPIEVVYTAVVRQLLDESGTTKQSYIERKSGELFELVKTEHTDTEFAEKPTHFLKNDRHTWSGTAKQFEERFERV